MNFSVASSRELSTDIAALLPSLLDVAKDLSAPGLRGTSLLFVDGGIADYQQLVAGATAGTEVHVLNSVQDAVTQITQVLLGREGISSLHIISHGEAGELGFGGDRLNLSVLPKYAAQLQSWGKALTDDADILLYGCNVAQGELGQTFVQIFSQLTGADVAGSDNLTGNGGDWTLEYNTGRIESASAFGAGVAQYTHTLLTPATVVLNTGSLYIENGVPIAIAPLGTVTDDNANFNAGTLTVSLPVSNPDPSDRLSILSTGSATGIAVNGRIVNFNGNRIGTFRGGNDGSNLVISFDTANATPVAAQALLNAIAFSNPSQNPAVGVRSIQVILNDGTDGSALVTQLLNVSAVNDAPILSNTRVLYEGSTNLRLDQTGADGTPGSTPWFNFISTTQVLGGTATNQFSNNGTTLTTDLQAYAGYTNYNFTPVQAGLNVTFTPNPNPAFPVLDRIQGFVLSFSAQVSAEDHTTSGMADKDQDGKADRAGFSALVVTSDRRAIELGFWNDRIFAQEDGATQNNRSAEPDSPFDPTRTLFTQAEFVATSTTALANYDLVVLGNTYELFRGGIRLLAGQLRDYSDVIIAPRTVVVPPGIPITVVPPNPYSLTNHVFFGDGTPSASATFTLTKVALNLPTPTQAFILPSLNEDAPAPTGPVGTAVSELLGSVIGSIAPRNVIDPEGPLAAGIAITSADSSNGTWYVGSGIGPVAWQLLGSASASNARLVNPSDRLYFQPTPNYFGTINNGLSFRIADGSSIATNTLVSGGSTPFSTGTLTAGITIVPVNDAPTVTLGANPTVTTGAGVQAITNFASFSPGPANEAGQTSLGYTILSNSNSSLFLVQPTIAPNGTLTYTPISTITSPQTAILTVQAQDNGGTADGGIDASATQSFTITVNPLVIPPIVSPPVVPPVTPPIVVPPVTPPIVEPPIVTPPIALPTGATPIFTVFQLGQTFTLSSVTQKLLAAQPLALQQLFDEEYYLSQNLDVAAALAKGVFQSGFQHFLQYGQFEERSPSSLFDESYYLSQNLDVAIAVSRGSFRSGFQHFLQFGQFEGRLPSSLFNEQSYLSQNPDVAIAVSRGSFRSGFQHFLQFGFTEGRLPSLTLFNESYYLSQNPDIAAAVARRQFKNGLQHFEQYGQREGRLPSPLFNERYYLSQNPDVAAAVAQGQFKSGFDHYLDFGRFEGRQGIG